MMFLDCPAYLDEDGAERCGLPAEVCDRFTVRSTGGPIENVRIRCPSGHWFNGPIESSPATRTPASSRSPRRFTVPPMTPVPAARGPELHQTEVAGGLGGGTDGVAAHAGDAPAARSRRRVHQRGLGGCCDPSHRTGEEPLLEPPPRRAGHPGAGSSWGVDPAFKQAGASTAR